MTQVTIDTPRGRARAHLTFPDGGGSAPAALVLGAGASGSVGAPDLLVAQRAALAGGCVSRDFTSTRSTGPDQRVKRLTL